MASGLFERLPSLKRTTLRPGHLMLSVDCPYSKPEQGTQWLHDLATILPPEEVEAIAHGNAEALLKLSGTLRHGT